MYKSHEGIGLRKNLAARQRSGADTVTRRLPSSRDRATQLPRDAAANASPTQLRGPHPERRIGARIDTSGKLVVENTAPCDDGYTGGRRNDRREGHGHAPTVGEAIADQSSRRTGMEVYASRTFATVRVSL